MNRSFLAVLLRVGRQRPERIHECRHCGTTLASETELCPYCFETDVIRYEIS
ncbi:hypothetical protein ACFQL3_05140 [Natronoarchaeum sp. GCM10025321]|uniref:hypothetical protein n=1 Tax=Natronoarchaeum sp. GCM10025321 TaxID=3252684 RepID=UPI00360F82D9